MGKTPLDLAMLRSDSDRVQVLAAWREIKGIRKFEEFKGQWNRVLKDESIKIAGESVEQQLANHRRGSQNLQLKRLLRYGADALLILKDQDLETNQPATKSRRRPLNPFGVQKRPATGRKIDFELDK